MIFAPLLTLLAASAATALIICCFFGGYSTSMLTNVYMLSFNTSELSSTTLDNTTSRQSGDLQFQNGRITLNATNYPRDDVHASDKSKSLDLYQYYAVYAITYCEGQYIPDYHDNDASPALSHCRRPSLTRHFDLISIVEHALEELLKTLSLHYDIDDLNWPDGLDNAFQYFKSARTAMVITSVAGVALALLLTAVALLAICFSYRWISMALFILSVLACISLAIAAGVSTTMINSVINTFGASGHEIGISAISGNLYLGLIWTAVALLLISTLTVTAQICMPDRNRYSRRRKHLNSRYNDYAMMPNMQDQWYNGSSRGQFGRLHEEEEEDFR